MMKRRTAKMKTDIEIAREAELMPIVKVAEKLGIKEEDRFEKLYELYK